MDTAMDKSEKRDKINENEKEIKNYFKEIIDKIEKIKKQHIEKKQNVHLEKQDINNFDDYLQGYQTFQKRYLRKLRKREKQKSKTAKEKQE